MNKIFRQAKELYEDQIDGITHFQNKGFKFCVSLGGSANSPLFFQFQMGYFGARDYTAIFSLFRDKCIFGIE